MIQHSNSKFYVPSPEVAKTKSSLLVMSEHDSITNQLIDQEVADILLHKSFHGLLQELHITDQQTYNNFPLFMRVVLNLPRDWDDKSQVDLF